PLMQHDLDSGALACFAPHASAMQPGGENLGVVDDEHIAGAQQIGKLAHTPVLARAGFADHKKPRRIAWVSGPQRNQLFGQVEIECVDAHYPALFSTAAMMRSCVASSR